MISSIKREKWFRIALGLLMIVMISGTLLFRSDNIYATRVIVTDYGDMVIKPPEINQTQVMGFELWNEANHSIVLPSGCLAYLQINQSGGLIDGDQQCIRTTGGEIAPGTTVLPYNASFSFWKVFNETTRLIPFTNTSNSTYLPIVNGTYHSILQFNVSATISSALQPLFGSVIGFRYNMSIEQSGFSWINFDVQLPQDYGMVTNSSNQPLHLWIKPQSQTGEFFPYRIKQRVTVTAQLLNRGNTKNLDYLDCVRPYLDVDFNGIPSYSHQPSLPFCTDVVMTHTIKEGLTEYKIPVDLEFYNYSSWQPSDPTGILTLRLVNPLVTNNHSYAAYIHYEHGKITKITYDKNYYIWH